MSYAYAETFEPIVKEGENVRLLPEDHPKAGFYRVKYVEPLHEIQYDFGTIAAGGESGDKEINNIYMPDNELAQYWIIVLDDIEVEVKQPKAKTRYVTDKKVTKITYFTQQISPYRNVVWVIEDEKIFFNASNPTRSSIPRARIKLFGWRYVLEPLAERPEKYATVYVGGR